MQTVDCAENCFLIGPNKFLSDFFRPDGHFSNEVGNRPLNGKQFCGVGSMGSFHFFFVHQRQCEYVLRRFVEYVFLNL